MLRSKKPVLIALCIAAALWWPHVPAAARKQQELRYSYDQVWNTALRLIRVDLRLPVTDRDREAGYLLFDYLDHEKRYAGSIEVIRAAPDKPLPVTAAVQVQGMPGYVEAMILDKLDRKLHADYGEPVRPKPPEKPVEPPAKPPIESDAGSS